MFVLSCGGKFLRDFSVHLPFSNCLRHSFQPVDGQYRYRRNFAEAQQAHRGVVALPAHYPRPGAV
jgi:hypothetical protein